MVALFHLYFQPWQQVPLEDQDKSLGQFAIPLGSATAEVLRLLFFLWGEARRTGNKKDHSMGSQCILLQSKDLQGAAGEGVGGAAPQHLDPMGVPHTLSTTHLALVSFQQEPGRIEPGSQHTQ